MRWNHATLLSLFLHALHKCYQAASNIVFIPSNKVVVAALFTTIAYTLGGTRQRFLFNLWKMSATFAVLLMVSHDVHMSMFYEVDIRLHE